jgi:spore photoproduct lyase
MKLPVPERVIVESAVAEGALAATLRKNLPSASFEIVDAIPDANTCDPKVLEVVRFRGKLLKSCPGTRNYHCCGYRILHFGVQCSLGCSYCILQAYLNQPNLRVFGNLDEIFGELSENLARDPHSLYRIGTGEFSDSLLLDPLTELSRLLVPYFAKASNAVLELKTKTNFIENLEGLDHGGHTIVAWSLNSSDIRKKEEPFAATIAERLEAARLCARRGYFLAFHFDPIIDYPGWQSGYGRTLDRLFATVDPARIVWISLGAFRFMPELKEIMRRRHPASRIAYGEFIPGLDGKMRYFRDIRAEFYSFMIDRIRRADPDLCAYLCMESSDIWKESLGFFPDERGGLGHMLDLAVEKKMNICPRSYTPS